MATKKANPKTEKQSEYSAHEFASIFPMMKEAELKLLAASIKRNGLREPIYLAEGKIIDGRNRLAACQLCGVPPRFEEVPEGTDLLEFALTVNVERRQMDASQRAMCAAKLEGYGHGGDRKSEDREPLLSLDDIAARFRVSKTYIKHARTILEQCDPVVISAVESGEIAVADAARPYVWENTSEIQERGVEMHSEPGPSMTLVDCIKKVCDEQEMERRRLEAVAAHRQAAKEKEEEERLKKLKASGLSEDEFARKEAERKAAMEAEQKEAEKAHQSEFELLDSIDPIAPLPFFDENGEPCHVDDIWDAAGTRIVDPNTGASRKVYIAADMEGLLFFRSAENARKFGIKSVLDMMQK